MTENKTIKIEQVDKKDEFQGIDSLNKQQLIDIVTRQNKMLQDADALIRKINVDNIFTRLDFLFRVLDHADDFDNNFINQCRQEIVELMTIKPKKADGVHKN